MRANRKENHKGPNHAQTVLKYNKITRTERVNRRHPYSLSLYKPSTHLIQTCHSSKKIQPPVVYGCIFVHVFIIPKTPCWVVVGPINAVGTCKQCGVESRDPAMLLHHAKRVCVIRRR